VSESDSVPRLMQLNHYRGGAGEPLVALQWLAANGCDANAQLSTAEEVVAAYQTSPEHDTMAAALAKLKRSP